MVDLFELRLSTERLASGTSVIEGLGAFARIGFRRGDLICIIQGTEVTIPQVKALYDRGVLRPSDPLQVSERRYLIMEPPFLHLNHSCSPNTAIVGERSLIAIQPIDQQEEITFDYAMTEWTWRGFGRHAQWNLPCKCGSPKCEGTIAHFPAMPLSRKREYWRRGALQDHILRRIVNAGLEYACK